MNMVRLCRVVAAAAILGGFVVKTRRRRRCDQLPARLDAVGLSPAVLLGEGTGLFSARKTSTSTSRRGAGSGKTVALMSGQQDDIGLADYMLMSVGVAKGMKLKGIFGEVQDGAWAIISRADSLRSRSRPT